MERGDRYLEPCFGEDCVFVVDGYIFSDGEHCIFLNYPLYDRHSFYLYYIHVECYYSTTTCNLNNSWVCTHVK